LVLRGGLVLAFRRSPGERQQRTPNEKQVGDRGIDGVVRFPLDAKGGVGRALVSVKGGKMLNPGMVRDLIDTVQAQRAEMGLLITLQQPTRGMEEAARHFGTFT
jgi:hypothetical protein